MQWVLIPSFTGSNPVAPVGMVAQPTVADDSRTFAARFLLSDQTEEGNVTC